MIDQINKLPEDGLKSSPETSRFTENKWISRKNQNKLYFLHLNASTLLALHRRPKIFETLFSITVIWSFKVRFSSVNTHKNLIEVIRFTSLSLIMNDGSFNEVLSFSRVL